MLIYRLFGIAHHENSLDCRFDLHGSTRRQGCCVGLERQDNQAVGCGSGSGFAETRVPFRTSHLSSLLAGLQDGRGGLVGLGLGLVIQLITVEETNSLIM